MRMQHWVFMAVLLAIGYAVGVMYPAIGQRLGL
jgi:hypothetical protein